MSLNLHLGEAFGLLMKTKTYLVYRAVIFALVAAAMTAALLFVALIGWVFGGGAAAVFFIIALAGSGWGMRLLKEYVLYMLQAGHIALVVELADRGTLPAGANQTEWARARVTEYFKEVSVLALIDQLVKGIIGALNRTVFSVMTILPIPGLDGVAKVAQKVVDFSLTYVDEAIIGHAFRTRNENVYEAARHGILLYCQIWKSLLKNAVALTLLSYIFTAAAFVVFLVPLGALALVLPASWGGVKFVLFLMALVLAVNSKWILFDPLAATATVLTFLRETEGLEPDPTWDARILAASDKFRELCDKAREKARELVQPEPEPAPALAETPAE